MTEKATLSITYTGDLQPKLDKALIEQLEKFDYALISSGFLFPVPGRDLNFEKKEKTK